MPAPDPVEERANPRLMQGMLWAGVGLAPVAALLLLFGDGTGTLRFAVLIVLVSIVLIGISVTLRAGSGASRVDLEEAMVEEMVKLRAEVRSEIANATRVGQAASQQRLQALGAALDGLQAQLAAVQGGAQDSGPVALAAPPGRAAIGASAAVPAPSSEPAGRATVSASAGYARASVAPPATDRPDDYGRRGYGQEQGGYDSGYGDDQDGYTPRRAQADDGGYTGRRSAAVEPDDVPGASPYQSSYGEDRRADDDYGQDRRAGDDYERSGYDQDGYDRGRRDEDRYGRSPGRDEQYGRDDQYEERRDRRQDRAADESGRARASGSASVGRAAGGRAQVSRGQLAGGIVRHTETVHVTTRSTIVDPRGDSGSLYGTGEFSGPRGGYGEDYGRETPDRGRRARNFDPGARDFDPAYRDFRSGGYGDDQEREEATDDVAGRRAARPGQPSWGERGDRDQTNPYDRPALEASAEPSWSQVRQEGDRYAAVRQDDRGQELRVGERRSSVRADDNGTEMRVEDRWASVRREDRAPNPYDRGPRTGQVPRVIEQGPRTGQIPRVTDQGPRTGQIPRVTGGEDPQPWRTQQRGGRRDEPWRVGPAEVVPAQDDDQRGRYDEPRGRYDDQRGRYDEPRGRYDEPRGRYDDSWRAERGDYREPAPQQQRFDPNSLYGEVSQFTGDQRAISAIEWDREDYRRR